MREARDLLPPFIINLESPKQHSFDPTETRSLSPGLDVFVFNDAA